jgi:hypothetical protein
MCKCDSCKYWQTQIDTAHSILMDAMYQRDCNRPGTQAYKALDACRRNIIYLRATKYAACHENNITTA